MRYYHKLSRNINSSSTKPGEGFTIIELTIVIVVIGILAAIVTSSYGNYLKTTTQTTVKSDLKAAITSLLDHQNFNNAFPLDIDDLTNIKTTEGVTLSGGSVDGGLTFCVDGQTTRYSDVKYFVDSESRQIKSGSCPETETAWLRLLLRGPNNGRVVVTDGLLTRECVKSSLADPRRCDFGYQTLSSGSGKTLTSIIAYPDNPADSSIMQWRNCWQVLITSEPSLGPGNFTNIGDNTYQVNFGPRTWVTNPVVNCWTEGY